MENAFKGIDKNKDGIIDRTELLETLHSQGQRSITEDEITNLMSSIDINKDGEVSFSEYVQMFKGIHKVKARDIMAKRDTKGHNVYKVPQGASTSFSSFSEEERSAYVKVINAVLKDDEDCKKYLPIDPDSMEIFQVMKDGILLCKLINCACKGTIDERTINKKALIN